MADTMDCADEKLSRYRPWFYAAAIYNAIWGAVTIVFPELFFDLTGMRIPTYPALWQVVGMLVMVFALGYWWAGRHPARHRHFILIGFVGKLLGPLGFVYSVSNSQLPLAFGWTIITNDLIWWPAFLLFLRDAARLCGGWMALVKGD